MGRHAGKRRGDRRDRHGHRLRPPGVRGPYPRHGRPGLPDRQPRTRRCRPRHPRGVAGVRERRQRRRARRGRVRLRPRGRALRPQRHLRRSGDRRRHRPGRRRNQHELRHRRQPAGGSWHRRRDRLRLQAGRRARGGGRRRPDRGAGRPVERAPADGHRAGHLQGEGPRRHGRERARRARELRGQGHPDLDRRIRDLRRVRRRRATRALRRVPGQPDHARDRVARHGRPAVQLPRGLQRRLALRLRRRHVDGGATGHGRRGDGSPPQPGPHGRRDHHARQAHGAPAGRLRLERRPGVGDPRRGRRHRRGAR